jgi:hypothetical protein
MSDMSVDLPHVIYGIQRSGLNRSPAARLAQ